jgi:cytochrome c-type biogenesis protein
VATLGFSLGIDEDAFRIAASVLMLAFGVVLLVPRLQDRIVATASHIAGSGGGGRLASFSPEGASGQFFLGLLLGAVWSPCVGPTLGAAATLAAGGEALGDVADVMLAFGVGAAIPLLVVGQLLSKGAALRPAWRSKLLSAGTLGKGVLGTALVLLAVVTFAGWDKRIEAELVARSPDWLTDLTTRY